MLSERVINSPGFIISEVILSQKNEFIIGDIFNSVFETLGYLFESEVALLNFIDLKIKALWEGRVLTFTGFAYYVSI